MMSMNVRRDFKGVLVCSNCGAGVKDDRSQISCWSCGIRQRLDLPLTEFELKQKREDAEINAEAKREKERTIRELSK